MRILVPVLALIVVFLSTGCAPTAPEAGELAQLAEAAAESHSGLPLAPPSIPQNVAPAPDPTVSEREARNSGDEVSPSGAVTTNPSHARLAAEDAGDEVKLPPATDEQHPFPAGRIPGPPPVKPSPPYESRQLTIEPALEALIRAYLGPDGESYGVVVKRLSDGRGVAINEDQVFYAASLYKLLVMYEVYKQRDLEMLTFDETLPFTESYLEYQIGPELWPLGSEIPIGELLEAMITVSDNVAAIMLHDRVGGYNIIADFKAIGLEITDISGDELPTSAGDMATWLDMIASGNAISRATSQEMVDLLANQQINDRLPALLPRGVLVAHKTGNWENATHDVGIVYAPSGTYIIAVLCNQPDNGAQIAELSLLVYNYFEQN